MPSIPKFKDPFALDLAVEQEIGKYLDKHLYLTSFENIRRTPEDNPQNEGSDIVLSSIDLDLKDVIVDEKAAAHYVNKDLQTFSFELSYYKNGILKEGWLCNTQKQTEYYMLIWPWADENQILYPLGEKYPYYIQSSITRLDYALVSRDVIMDYLAKKGFNQEWLNKTMSNIRELASKHDGLFKKKYRSLTFSCSGQLPERPVNVLISKRALINMSIFNGTC